MLNVLYQLYLSFIRNNSQDELTIHSDYVDDSSVNEWAYNLGLLDEMFSTMFSSCIRIDSMIVCKSKVLDTNMKTILNLYHKDMSSQIFKNGSEIIQSYEIVGSILSNILNSTNLALHLKTILWETLAIAKKLKIQLQKNKESFQLNFLLL